MIFLYRDEKYLSVIADGRQEMMPMSRLCEAMFARQLIDLSVETFEKEISAVLDNFEELGDGYFVYLKAQIMNIDGGRSYEVEYGQRIRESARMGYPVAMFALSLFLMTGSHGFTTDKVEAERLLKGAAELGHVKSSFFSGVPVPSLAIAEGHPSRSEVDRYCAALGLQEAIDKCGLVPSGGPEYTFYE